MSQIAFAKATTHEGSRSLTTPPEVRSPKLRLKGDGGRRQAAIMPSAEVDTAAVGSRWAPGTGARSSERADATWVPRLTAAAQALARAIGVGQRPVTCY